MAAVTPPETEPPDLQRGRFSGSPEQSLRSRAARGVIVNAGFNIVVQGLTAVQGLLLATLLPVDQYGLWGLIGVTLGTLLWLGGIGLDDKYIQQDEHDQVSAFQIAFTLQTLLCTLFIGLVAITVPLFALAYDKPEFVAPALVLGLGAMPAIALQTPLWAFYRQMDFMKQRRLQLWGPVVSLVLLVPLAAAGLGVWAPVIATLASAWAIAIAALWASPYPLRFRWRRGALREYTTFSVPIFISSATGVLGAQIPVLVAANTLGVNAIAALTLANTLAVFAYRVDALVTGTLYPAICAVADRVDLLYETFSKSNRLALLWAMPCGMGVVLFAQDFVDFVLGDEWSFAVPLIQITAACAAVNQIAFNWGAFFRARADTRPMAVSDTAAFVTMMGVGLPLLIGDGLVGYGIGLAAATCVALVIRIIYLTRLFPALSIIGHSARATLATVPAVAVIGLLRLAGGDRGLLRAIGEAVLFVAIAAASSYLLEGRLVREAVQYLRRRAAPATAPA